MSAKSRNKGSSFERQIAQELFLLTGISFKRNLEQTREAAHGDLVADNPAWPFSCELKRRAAGISCLTAWKEQATRAAALTGKTACVIFKFDRQPIRVAVPLAALVAGADAEEWAEVTLEAFAFVAREMMAGAA